MPELGGVDYIIRQAAIWIVTDDVDSDDLAILEECVNGNCRRATYEEERQAQ